MRGRAMAVLLAAAVVLAGCDGQDRKVGEQTVRTYLDLLVKAYRNSDTTLIDPITGDELGRKVLGLIGVKRDMNLYLDATVEELVFEGVTRKGDVLEVSTRERWYYQDRRIGGGERQGQDSRDSYHMRYTVAREGGKWLVIRTDFIDPPQVGRAPTEQRIPLRDAHGLSQEEAPASPIRSPMTNPGSTP